MFKPALVALSLFLLPVDTDGELSDTDVELSAIFLASCLYACYHISCHDNCHGHGVSVQQ